jgi:hypothetical protein
MPRGVSITIPEEVDLAIRAEAYRRGCRPGEVLTQWLRATLPDYVRDQFRRDLLHPTTRDVIDAHVLDCPIRDAEEPTVEPPALHERPAQNATRTLPPERPELGGSGDAID